MTSPVLISETQANYQDTESSTAQTIREMCGHIRASIPDPVVQQCAASIGPVSSRDRRGLAEAVWRWCKRNIDFVTDEDQMQRLLGRGDELELLISPSVMVRLAQKRGDCDCFVMTACALLSCLGVPCAIKTFKCSREEPWRWSHVCAAAVLEDGSIFPVDASHGDYPGWQVPPQDVYSSQLWDMSGNRIGGPMRTNRGMGAYQSERGWSGDPMTASQGVGPYVNEDVMRYWKSIGRGNTASARARGLGAIARAKYSGGLGDCVNGFDDESGEACSGSSPAVTVPPPSNAPGPNYVDSVTGNLINGATGQIIGPAPVSAAPFNFGNFLGSLIAPAAALTSKALTPGAQVLANGNILLPNGTIVSGTPTASSISTSTLMIIGAVVVGVVLLAGKK